MSNSIPASAVNAGGVTPLPRKLSLSLMLEVEVENAEALEYLVDSEGNLQLGLIADLFDVLNFDMELGVQSINGITQEDCRRTFQKLL